MTNFKKIGLTALAGTLAATAYAQAGALSVSGTARMEYQSTQASTTSKSDAFAQNTTISFTGSGELDNGMTVSYLQAQSGAGTLTSQGVTLDMGDMGSVAITNYNFGGIGTIQDMVPNGGEQPWDDNASTHGAPEQGVADPHGAPMLGYTTTVGGTTVSAAMSYDQNSPTTSIAVSFTGVEGLNVGAGIATDQDSATTEQDISTMYATYTMGNISVGYQTTDVEPTASGSDIERTSYGISMAVNENMSIGYGISDTEFESSSLTLDEENAGIGMSYTSGGMTLGIQNITKDNPGGSAGELETTEFQLTFAF